VSLRITPGEKFAVLTLAALLLGGGLVPQLHIESRNRAAEEVLRDRSTHVPEAAGEH
jgi:hypothetical protein